MSNPLLKLHESADAEFQSYADTPIVSTFGLPQLEYAAIRKSAAILDLPQRGLLEVTGPDRLPFLNNLLTNQTWDKAARAPMPANTGVYAFFLNTKGRIVADMNVLELGNRTLLEMDARYVEPVRQAMDKYLFADKVKLAVQSDTFHEMTLMGPSAATLLSQSLGISLPDLPLLSSIELRLLGHNVLVWRDDPTGVPGYTLIVPAPAAEPIWTHLANSETAARPTGWAAFNATRIEAGRPLFGIDFDETVLPAETGLLDRAVSFTKGCYLGQEIVARMHARGQLARQIVGFRMSGDALPVAGTAFLDDDGNEIGLVTSSTLSPVLSNAPIGLGMLKKPYMSVGANLFVAAEGALHAATVAELPFVKP